MAATGRQLKQSVNVFHKRMLYLRLPEHVKEAKECQLRLCNNTQSLTLIVKAVYPVNAGTLMIASEQKEVFRVLDFVCQEQTNCL